MPDVKHFDPEEVLEQVERLFWQRGATTGIAEVVAATGISRSSLYATFGGKRELYVQALRRYVERRSAPVLDALAADGRGLAAVEAFFDRLIASRCTGEHARWGCLVTNAHAQAEGGDPEVRAVLDGHQARLRAAFRAALEPGALRPGLDPDGAAELLTLLAYGVNLRSRAGAHPDDLRRGVSAALDSLRTEEHP
ncbi:TetR/AcrR family transcriptional regulator [Actinomadura sp. ATCC 31491]|uniref:TetR/AcrR family transcriptional regulator n=1 Tax=Actinomadura luzonensis TaxID=2805427 RepID=A0ABT0FLQ4_9ACTN|nr:TetR/AcrR family transcriptional regulator [Actinomadura luzonensis]MCK2213264.1 TetR/AcrR family transcriptional regulator [Actinomadura luzonensis]